MKCKTTQQVHANLDFYHFNHDLDTSSLNKQKKNQRKVKQRKISLKHVKNQFYTKFLEPLGSEGTAD